LGQASAILFVESADLAAWFFVKSSLLSVMMCYSCLSFCFIAQRKNAQRFNGLLFIALVVSVKLFINFVICYMTPSKDNVLTWLSLNALIPLWLYAAFEMLAVA